MLSVQTPELRCTVIFYCYFAHIKYFLCDTIHDVKSVLPLVSHFQLHVFCRLCHRAHYGKL